MRKGSGFNVDAWLLRAKPQTQCGCFNPFPYPEMSSEPSPWTLGQHSGGRQGHPGVRQVAPDGAPRDRLSVYFKLSTQRNLAMIVAFCLTCLRAQTAMPCIGRWTAPHR